MERDMSDIMNFSKFRRALCILDEIIFFINFAYSGTSYLSINAGPAVYKTSTAIMLM